MRGTVLILIMLATLTTCGFICGSDDGGGPPPPPSTPDITWTKIASLNTARIRARSEVLNGQMYCIGGVSGTAALNTVEKYEGGQWSIVNGQLFVPRFEFTSCTFGNNLYVFGGLSNGSVTDVVESFDGTSWTQFGAMPVPLHDCDGTILGSSFYIFGGIKNTGPSFLYDNKVRRFSPSSGWTEVGDIVAPPNSQFTYRSGYGCVSAGSYIYVIGGAYAPNSTATPTYFRDVWMFDPSASSSNKWQQKASMTNSRADFACFSMGGRIYVVGGVSVPSPEHSIERYDPQTNTWSNIADQPDLSIPQPTRTTLDGKIYVLGLSASFKDCYESNQISPGATQIQGSCQQVLSYYPVGTMLYGQEARGAEGDFSCYSDVFTEHGVRISPWGGSGRAYYDFGPVNQNTVSITFTWVDNAWVSDLKALDIFNWSSNTWERIISWSGNDGRSHTDTYQTNVSSARKGPDNQVRVALFGAPSSVIHLNTITVN